MEVLRKPFYRDSIRFIEESNSFCEGSKQLIAKAVISHVSDILEMSLEMLANDTQLSDASISRFFKRLDFDSFHKFKSEFSEFMMTQQLTTIKSSFTCISSKDQDFMKTAYKSLGNISNEIKDAAVMIKQSDHVVLFGEMFDLMPFFSLQVNLISNSISAYFCRLSEIEQFPESFLKGNTLFICLDNCEEFGNEIKTLINKTSAKQISMGMKQTTKKDADLFIELPYRTNDFNDSNSLSMFSAVLLNEYLKAEKMRL